MKIKVSGEYTLAEIEVELDQQLTPNDLQPGATVLATNESTGGLERIVSHEELSRFFAVGPPVALPMPTDVVVERTLADPAFKQILQEADGKKGFDPEAEQMKIRDFLAGVTNSKMTTEQSVFHGSRSNTSAPIVSRIKCPTCLVQFDAVAFQNHACEAKPAELAVPQQEKPHLVPTVSAPPAPIIKPACERVIKENQVRLRRYFKDEMKYDLATGIESSRIQKNTSKGPNECTMCDRKFVHASGLVRHMEKHALDLIPSQTSEQPHTIPAAGLHVVVKCNPCGRIFYDPQVAFRHGFIHDSEHSTMRQGRMPQVPSSRADFNELLLDGESLIDNDASFAESNPNTNPSEKEMFTSLILGSVLQCEFCEYIFADIAELLVHSASHVAERRFECTACDIQMSTAKEASIHFQTDCIFMREAVRSLNVTISRYFVCNVCELKFANTDLLQEHRCTSFHYFPRLSENGKKLVLPCEFCDVNFEFAHEFLAHNEEKHLNKKKREKEARNTGAGRIRQYLCDICGKSYTQSSHLWQHLRFHQGVKPFVCQEENCDRKFTIRPDLNDHIRKCHTGERPYLCLVCGKRFLTGSVFYQHRLIHRGERRYECDECGKRFYRADALKNHQRIHTGEKPYSCLFCTKTFRQRGDRDKHIRARHSHLDANSRLMMQMQKFQLETAAAQKAQGHNPEQQDNDGGASTLDVPSGSGFVSTEPGVAEMQYSIAPEQQDEMVCVPIDQVNNSFFMSHYMQAVPMEEDGSGQHIIVFEQPGQDMDMISIYDQQQVGEPMDEGGVPQLAPEETARVVVVKNNPTKPIFSDTYM
ncbi:testis-specific zinc finger protein topi [Drosophila sechellia]|uniref:GM23838 n=1 Tax=Drosophila sechellia TaxID=7238 RepID=B4HJS8_DROSE|nr:testis-specific zinc finger protein topi [Drosophila sechellia]EDW42812.1 GM23838 [Drosophila sechellia]